MNRLNLGFLDRFSTNMHINSSITMPAKTAQTAIINTTFKQEQAPIPKGITKPELLTKTGAYNPKSHNMVNKTKKNKNESSGEEETDVNLIIKKIISKKPSVNKVRKKFKRIVMLQEDESSDELF